MARLNVDLVEVKFAQDGSAPPRSFKGYGSVFGNVDAYGDVVAPGAFTRTLEAYKARGRMPAMLSQHGGLLPTAEGVTPLGVWTHMSEDEKGLRVEGFLSDTTRGNEHYTLLKDGALWGLSIGFVAKDFALGKGRGEPRRTLKDLELLEVSLVTSPANVLAQAIDIKNNLDVLDEELREAGLSRSVRRKALAIVRRRFLPDGGTAETEPREEATAAELAEGFKTFTAKLLSLNARKNSNAIG